MNHIWSVLIALACLSSTAPAQVPEMGRWQDLDFSAEEVHSRVADQYDEILADLRARECLDDDPALLARVRHVAETVIQAAVVLKPEAAQWQWAVHTTSDPQVEAFGMAGGKLMIGSRFVRRLNLSDGELATLIGHEVAHAVADHHREALSIVLHISPMPKASLEVVMSRLDSDLSLQLRLARLSSMQEREADQLGMILAHKAGWPATSMLSFYRKLAASEAPSALSSSHPSSHSRLGMAKGMALLFGE